MQHDGDRAGMPNRSTCRSEGVSPPRSRPLSRQTGQRGFDFSAAGFEESWQLEFGSQVFHRFIDRKARLIGRDLEQNAARLAEIDGAEILPVLLFRVLQPVILFNL